MVKHNKQAILIYDPEGNWNCSWQDKYGGSGNLKQCLDIVFNYIEMDERDVHEVRQELLIYGRASRYWWSINYEKEVEADKWDKDEDVNLIGRCQSTDQDWIEESDRHYWLNKYERECESE